MELRIKKLLIWIFTQNDEFLSIKLRVPAGGDILRVSEIYQNCRYAKKTQISLDPKKYRYVGANLKF
jgi:hypothetical protein